MKELGIILSDDELFAMRSKVFFKVFFAIVNYTYANATEISNLTKIQYPLVFKTLKHGVDIGLFIKKNNKYQINWSTFFGLWKSAIYDYNEHLRQLFEKLKSTALIDPNFLFELSPKISDEHIVGQAMDQELFREFIKQYFWEMSRTYCRKETTFSDFLLFDFFVYLDYCMEHLCANESKSNGLFSILKSISKATNRIYSLWKTDAQSMYKVLKELQDKTQSS